MTYKQTLIISWRILTYPDVSWRILTYGTTRTYKQTLSISWRMMTCTDVCWRMLTWRMLTYAIMWTPHRGARIFRRKDPKGTLSTRDNDDQITPMTDKMSQHYFVPKSHFTPPIPKRELNVNLMSLFLHTHTLLFTVWTNIHGTRSMYGLLFTVLPEFEVRHQHCVLSKHATKIQQFFFYYVLVPLAQLRGYSKDSFFEYFTKVFE